MYISWEIYNKVRLKEANLSYTTSSTLLVIIFRFSCKQRTYKYFFPKANLNIQVRGI